MPVLTVLFATFNGADTLPATLQALSELVPPPGGWRLVAVDNGSSDTTPDILRLFADRLPLSVLTHPPRGKNRALNAGLTLCAGDAIVFTDDDVLPCRDWLTAWRAVLDDHPDSAVFGGPIRPAWARDPPRWLLDGVPLGPAYAVLDEDCREGPVGPGAIWGPNMAIRASVFAAGHRFDEHVGPDGSSTYAMGSEVEFTRRLAALGHRCRHDKRPVVHHIVPAHAMTAAWLKARARRYGRGEYAQRRRTRPDDAGLNARRWLLRKAAEAAVSELTCRMLGRPAEAAAAAWRRHAALGQLEAIREAMCRTPPAIQSPSGPGLTATLPGDHHAGL
jgi:glycosyltransferase involved in cell wall biosynthesis